MKNKEIALKLMELAVSLLNDQPKEANEQESNCEKDKVDTNEEVSETVAEKPKRKGSKKSDKKDEVVPPPEPEEEASDEMIDVPSQYKDIPPEKEAKPAKGTVFYDRESKEQKSIMSNFLTRLTGNEEWKAPANKESSRKLSMSLQGKPFLDKKGEVLDSFIEACKDHFGIE